MSDSAIKIKNAQAIKDSFEIILSNSRRQPKYFKTDDEKEFVNKIFTMSLTNDNIKESSNYIAEAAFFGNRVTKTNRNPLEKSVLEKNAKWVRVLSTNTMKNSKTKQSTNKVTPVKVSLKKNGKEVLDSLNNKRVRTTPKLEIADLVRTTDKRNSFFEGDTTNWSDKVHTKHRNC